MYIFEKEGLAWSQQLKLVAADGNEEDYLGSSVCMSGKRVVIGAPQKGENGVHTGKILYHLFVF